MSLSCWITGFILKVFLSVMLVAKTEAHPNFKHEPYKLEVKRQAHDHDRPLAGPPTAFESTFDESLRVLTLFTPSPSASPIPITEQSQVETTYVPQYTLCALPPLAFLPAAVTTNPVDSGPYRNYSISTPSGNGTCITQYEPLETTICATVLTGIATRITVSECEQDITFSSRYGYVLRTAEAETANASLATSPTPSIQTLTTYYLAPWQSLTEPSAPSDVDVKICAIVDDGSRQCVNVREVWHVELVIITRTLTTEINLTTRVPGPAQFLIETIEVDITRDQTILSLSTTMKLVYELETESTSTSTRSTVLSAPGLTLTRTQTQTLTRALSEYVLKT